jgi:hypothetical protein
MSDDENQTERLRRKVQEFCAARHPFGQGHGDIVEWLSLLPVKVREAIFLVLDGHHAQDHRAHLKGARTARSRREVK